MKHQRRPSGRRFLKGDPAPTGCRVRICAGTSSRRCVPLRTNADRASGRNQRPGQHQKPAISDSSSIRNSNRSRPGPAEYPAPTGCRVRICAGTSSRRCVPLRTNADRAPSGSAMRSAVPATRQAVGASSAWSQPCQSTPARPRRWCDAGPPGRQCVTATQKAGVEDIVRVATCVSGNAPPTRFSNRAPRECPLKRCLGPKRAAFGEVLHPKIGLRRHVRSRPKDAVRQE